MDYVGLSSVKNVDAGGTATLTLPTSGTYHGIDLTYTTATVGGADQVNMEAEIEEIRVIVNDKVQRRMTMRQLIDINARKGQAFNPGFIEIFFGEPWRRTAQGEDALAWGMADVDTFHIEIDIAAGAVTPTLSAQKLWDSVTRPMGPIVKWRQSTVTVGATGHVDVTTWSKKDAYYGIHCDSTDILDVTISTDQTEKREFTKAQSDLLAGKFGRPAHADWLHIDFDMNNRASSVLTLQKPSGGEVDEFEVVFNMGAANSFTVVREVLGLRD